MSRKGKADDADDWDPDAYRTAEELQNTMDDDAARARMSSQERREIEGTASMHSFDSDDTQITRYTFYNTAADGASDPDAPESPERRRRRRKDRRDPYAGVLRKMLERARISAHHVDNLPREGKIGTLHMTRGAQTAYKKIADRRPFNENYHWLPSLTEEEQLQQDIETALNDDVLAVLSPKEQVLSVLRKNPMSPEQLDRVKRHLPFEDPEHPPPGLSPLNPHWKKQNPAHGTNKYFNYDGQWSKGKMNGNGRFCFLDGSTYEGEWRENRRHGTGVATYKEGHTYEGQWKDGRMHGQGRLATRVGIVYEGHFAKGKRHGKGVMRWPNGMVYRGDFKDGEMHGMGNIQNKMGNKFIGEFRTGRIEGAGALYNPAGKRTSRVDWPRKTLPGLVVWQKEEEAYEAEWRKEERLDLTWDLDGVALAKYVADVRAYNIEVQEEKERMEAEKDRLEREERRNKMRAAKIAAQEASAAN